MSKNLLAFPLVLIAACTATPSEPGTPACDVLPQTHHYRVDRVSAPDSADPSAIGFDLDGDNNPDNFAGTVLSDVLTIYDARTAYQADLDARLTGDVSWTIDIQRCPTTLANFVTVGGDDPDAIPLGALADLGGGAEAGWQPVDDLQAAIVVTDGVATGHIGGALTGDYRTAIARSFAPYISARLAAGQTQWGAQADLDGDGTVSVDELLADGNFRALTGPDVDLDGDGTLDAMSFAFTIHATEIAR